MKRFYLNTFRNLTLTLSHQGVVACSVFCDFSTQKQRSKIQTWPPHRMEMSEIRTVMNFVITVTDMEHWSIVGTLLCDITQYSIEFVRFLD